MPSGKFGTTSSGAASPSPIRTGALWPALQYRKYPVLRSSTPMKKVTNMLFSFVLDMDSFIWLTICRGLFSCEETERNRLRVTAITSEAGTPLPDTSPMQK